MQQLAPDAKVLVTADFFYLARRLYEENATFVFIPRLMSVHDLAEATLSLINGTTEPLRAAALEEISGREEVLP